MQLKGSDRRNAIMVSFSGNKYEPLPRFDHNLGRVGNKALVQGGRTKDFTEASRKQLSSVVEIFDLQSESWKQRQVEGDTPFPGTRAASSTSLNGDLFSFGGRLDHDVGIGVPVLRFNTLHRLSTKNWCWCKLSPQNADGAPMPKILCGMIAFGNSLGVFGGSEIPQGPTEPQSFIANTRTTSGAGWTNEFHVYDVSEGIVSKV